MKLFRLILIVCGLFQLGILEIAVAADANFEGPHFSGSGNCSVCHDGITDGQGKDVSIIKDWSTSMMANATRDPYWRAKVASELHRNPHLSDEINDTCLRCHAPMASVSAKREGVTIELFGNGFLNPSNPYYNHALDGVSCTACHQISDNDNLGTLAGVSGNYTILQYVNPVDRPAFGQYEDPETSDMQDTAQFTPQHSSHMGTSKLCATCHDLKTAFVDAFGNVASTTPESEFPEQMVYTEWNNSAYKVGGVREQNCQSCHMPKVGFVTIAITPNTLGPLPDFSKHTFLGANTTMMDMMNSHRVELDVSATGFEQSIQANREFLKSAADIEVLTKEMVGNHLKVELKITNKAGHKLPTSYPSRRAYIHFVVKDDNGQTIFESGKLNANGSISGVAADVDSSTYEPHYDQITSEDQVQIYEAIMKNTDGAVTHTLLRAAAYIKDNRISPAGFEKSQAPSDVAVVGAANSDENFNLGSDKITYLVDVGSNVKPTVTASLEYQTLAYSHLQDLFQDTVVPEVATFKSYFDNANIRSETIDEVLTGSDDEVLKRGEMAKAILQKKNIIPAVASGAIFNDVPLDHLYVDWIEQFNANGLTEGCSNNNFCPDMVVTREQLAKIFLKSFEGANYLPSPVGPTFDDVSLADFNGEWITELRDRGFTQGCASDRFCPKQVATLKWFNDLLKRLVLVPVNN